MSKPFSGLAALTAACALAGAVSAQTTTCYVAPSGPTVVTPFAPPCTVGTCNNPTSAGISGSFTVEGPIDEASADDITDFSFSMGGTAGWTRQPWACWNQPLSGAGRLTSATDNHPSTHQQKRAGQSHDEVPPEWDRGDYGGRAQ